MVGLLFSPLQSFLVFHISMIILGLILIPNVFIFNLNYLSIQFAITCTYNLAILGCSQSRELFYNHEKNMFKSVIFVDLLHALDFQDQKLSMCIGLLKKSNDTATNSYTNLFCTNWCGMIKLIELNITWPTWFVFINLYFHSTNDIMPRQFVQNKFVQEFVAVSLLLEKSSPKE